MASVPMGLYHWQAAFWLCYNKRNGAERTATEMVKKIALLNHRSGVGKTTTAFTLGWMLASRGKRVVLVDADPQCDLTALALGDKTESWYERPQRYGERRDLKAGLSPAFEAMPIPIAPVDCIPVDGRDGLFLLPGHIGLSEYDVILGIAQELSESLQTLQNLPGSISCLLDKTAEQLEADCLLIDMAPSLSPLNQNLLMTSDFFIVPATPDYFSAAAIASLCDLIPHWQRWSKKAHSLPALRNAAYPFPDAAPRFLGAVVQNHRPGRDATAAVLQKWTGKIKETVSGKLAPRLSEAGLALPPQVYAECRVEDFCLATVPDFNSLTAKSQKFRVPVFALSHEQLGQSGADFEKAVNSRDQIRRIFSELSDKVIGLARHASGD